MHKWIVGLCSLCVSAPLALGACQTAVHVEPVSNWSNRQVEARTHQSVIRDYLESWKSLRTAFASNNAGLLAHDFAGLARDELAASIEEQAKSGLSSDYCDRTHNIQIVFYSPEGISIQLIDKVDYQLSIKEHGKPLATRQIHARYVAVLTPSATRWMVRIFQGGGN